MELFTLPVEEELLEPVKYYYEQSGKNIRKTFMLPKNIKFLNRCIFNKVIVITEKSTDIDKLIETIHLKIIFNINASSKK